eukprot:CAMPEP_0176019514 /NCGR_PEP_ID=MMETSP0120_2-20121206/9429_1 /TAXON_ID=160619 /ORGANISM="Kryptoperidinium foliaceum, Strain CCMP 1326" /LENGTH=356 /DNA_ID=CAMNT_0017352591 /DNA_START=47 /DNA_END=1117 /DNA_ORIENTATION=-
MSRSADTAVGMMDSAYFVGRMELLEFFNNLLDLHLAKIEETASGAIACQLTEYIYPGSVPMSKVNWEAKADYEFVNNYKLLQKAFSKHKVQRHVDVDKLIRAKYQDNLEFCQWLKAFYDQSGVVRDDYDPKAVRAKGKGGKKYDQQAVAKAASRPVINRARAPARPTPAASKPRPTTAAAAHKPKPRPTPAASRPAANRAPVTSAAKGPLRASENKTRPGPGAAQAKATADAQLTKKNAELESKVEELETTVLELEKERDFYFGKLRNVELMLQVKQDANFEGCDLESVVGNIFKVLYATAEEEVEVAEDGEILHSRTENSADFSENVADQSKAEASHDPAVETSVVDTSVEQEAY